MHFAAAAQVLLRFELQPLAARSRLLAHHADLDSLGENG
jgi:hypothetical protein